MEQEEVEKESTKRVEIEGDSEIKDDSDISEEAETSFSYAEDTASSISETSSISENDDEIDQVNGGSPSNSTIQSNWYW